MEQWWPVVPGGLLVVVALRDVFHTLWHPSGTGRVSGALTAAMWAAARRRRSRAGALVGPASVVATVVLWVVLLGLGWALVYWPFLADDFVFSGDLDRSARGGFLDALYLSTVVLATLGFGDIVPSGGGLRLVTAAQALVGFALLTAGVSWLIQVEAALSRRRALARYLSLLRRTVDRQGPSALGAVSLDRVTADLARARVDLSHTTVTYYFTDQDREESLAATLPWAVGVAESATDATDPGTSAAAASALLAAEDLLALIDTQLLHGDGSRADALRGFAEQHGYADAV